LREQARQKSLAALLTYSAGLQFEPPAYMKGMMEKMEAEKGSLSPYTCE